MKRIAALTTSFLIALSALSGIAAYADGGENTAVTRYPEDAEFTKTLEFSNLCDFAVDGNTYYFAEGNKISIFDGTALSSYTHAAQTRIVGLDFDGIPYFCDSGNNTYSLYLDENGEYQSREAEHTFTMLEYIPSSEGIYRLDDGKLDFCAKGEDNFNPIDGVYSNLKKYGDGIYAMCGNRVYSISELNAQPIQFEYFFDAANLNAIAIGDTAQRLNTFNLLTFVNVQQGSYMTEIDLTALDGGNFETGETITAGQDVCALLLGYAGDNAAIIAIGKKSYILLKSKISAASGQYFTAAPENSFVTMMGIDIYPSPFVYMNNVTAVNTGASVKLLGTVEYDGVLEFIFYKVEYEYADGTTVQGYITKSLSSEIYIVEDNEPPTQRDDADFSEKDNTKTILLVFAVVVLVLIAIGYVAYIGTADKRKNKKKKDKEEKSE